MCSECSRDILAGYERDTERERDLRQKSQLFCALILEVPFHPICHVLFIRSKLPGPVHTKEEESVNVRKQGSLKTILDSAYHKLVDFLGSGDAMLHT
jgi:hypothetical protein